MKKILTVIIIIIIIIIALCLVSCDKSRQDTRFGNNAYNKKDYKKAHDYYKKALNQDSTFKKADYNLANTYMQDKTQDYEKAIEYYNKFLNQKPNDSKKAKKQYAKGLYNRGNAFFNMSQQDKASEKSMKYLAQAANDYKNVLMLNPTDSNAKYNYALCLWLMKNNNNPDNNNDNNQNSSNSEINQMLEAMKNNEKNTISRVKKNKENVKNQKNEKDW